MNGIKQENIIYRQLSIYKSTKSISGKSQEGDPCHPFCHSAHRNVGSTGIAVYHSAHRNVGSTGIAVYHSDHRNVYSTGVAICRSDHRNVGSTGVAICRSDHRNVGSTGVDLIKCFLITLLCMIFTILFPISASAQAWESTDGNNTRQEEVVMRIMLGKIKGNLRVSSPGGIKISVPGSEGEILLSSSETYTFNREAGKISMDNGGKKELGEEIVISAASPDSPLKINDIRYRGQLRVLLANDFLWLINLVPLEKYLYGVVPKEFKTTYPELAKAQAIVARTYALGHRGRFEKQGFDFTNDSSFQVYGGFDAEDKICSAAVDATKGMVLLFEGKPARYPLYHSTCGGSTEDNESVYLTDPIPYLRSRVCDDKMPEEDMKTEEKTADKNPDNSIAEDKGTTTNNSGKKEGNGKIDGGGSEDEIIIVGDDPDEMPLIDIDFEGAKNSSCNLSRMFRWKFQWDNEEMSNLVKMTFPGKDTGTVIDVQVKKRGRSGRVVILSFVTDKGVFDVKGDDIRGVLKFKSPYGYYQNLYSTRFNIIKKEENGKTVWMADGSGWGHGLGMCQFGALGLAKKGATARQILQKYFKGTNIGEFNQPPISKQEN